MQETQLRKLEIDKPKVSIITVVYNCEKTIETTIESVLSQTYNNIEYIIVDGKSNDNTLAKIYKYRSYITKIISEKDSGIYDAMNKGISYATGDLIGTLNADDRLHSKSSVEQIVELYRPKEKNYIIHGNINMMFKDGSFITRIPKCRKIDLEIKGMRLNHPTFYVHNSIYKETKYSAKYKVASDFMFTLECFQKNVDFLYLNEVIVDFSTEGISSKNKVNLLVEGIKIRRELGLNYVIICISTIFRSALFTLGFLKNRLNRLL